MITTGHLLACTVVYSTVIPKNVTVSAKCDTLSFNMSCPNSKIRGSLASLKKVVLATAYTITSDTSLLFSESSNKIFMIIVVSVLWQLRYCVRSTERQWMAFTFAYLFMPILSSRCYSDIKKNDSILFANNKNYINIYYVLVNFVIKNLA